MLRLRWLLPVAVFAAGCGMMQPGPACRVGADCASGVCNRDGTCAPVMMGGGSAAGGSAGDGGQAGGATAGGTATAGGAAGGSSGGAGGGSMMGCQTNQDGTITRQEVVTAAGLRATFRVSGEAMFDTAGAALPDGGREWDLRPMLAGDMNTLVETQQIQGRWFEANYPDAGYVVPLGQGTDLLGVFASTPDGLYLMGSASPNAGATSTRLVYTPPVKVLQFPLRAGDTWSTTSSVTGNANGIPLVSVPNLIGYTTETYSSTVDRAGDALVPYAGARFPVLRVRTTMQRSVFLNPAGSTSFRQFQFVTECFGTVATIRSRDGESSTEFTSAKEVRRLAQ